MKAILDALNISSSPLINAAIAFGAFIIFAKIIDLIINKGIRRMTRRTDSPLDDNLIDIIHRPIYFTIILTGLVLAIQYINPAERTALISRASIYTLMTLIWSLAAMRFNNIFVVGLFKRGSDVTGLSKDLLPLIKNLMKIVIFIVSIYAIFTVWKINVTPLLASAGLVGAGVAIAAKDTISNLFGGVSVFLDRPFVVGDYIVLDGGERGEVVTIGLRSTRIETRDHIQIIIPNSIIANSKVINESAPVPYFRVRVPVGVAYGSDIEAVEDILLRAAKGNANVIPTPEPRVRFREFGDSSLNFELLCWATDPSVRGLTIHELNCEIYHKFEELGISIPFPQRDLHIIKDDAEGIES